MSQADKDKYVHNYVAIAPPYTGATQTAKFPIGMDDANQINIPFAHLGITADVFVKTSIKYPSAYDLMPRKFALNSRGQKWYNDFLRRSDEERNGKTITKGNIMDIFPTPSDSCVSYLHDRWYKSKNKCNIGAKIYKDSQFAKIEG